MRGEGAWPKGRVELDCLIIERQLVPSRPGVTQRKRERERERDENFEKENKTNKEEKKKRTDAIRNLRATNDGGPDQASREGQGEGLGGRGGWEEVLV